MKRARHRSALLGSLLFAAAVAVVCCAAASAAGAPTALTGPVSAVTGTGATVSGTVDPNGTATTWFVEYGTSTAYGSKTAPASAGSGTANLGVSSALAGLTPGTTYHYRVDATSSAGTAQGADGIFTTAAAPTALTGPATGLTATTATLTGSVDPAGEATTYSFQYGKTTSYGSQTATASAGTGNAAVSVTATVSGLTPGQTYHFRLVATSAAGTTTGADASFALSGAPVATTGAVTGQTATGATLTGSVDPDGEQTTWYFQYGKTTSYGSQTPAGSVAAGTQAVSVSSPLTGLAGATRYHYRLVATNASGTSDGADRTFGNFPAPVAQTGSAEGAGATSVTLTGTVNPQGSATSWHFQYGTTTAYGAVSASQSAGSGTAARTVTAAIGGLSPATTYHYRIVASNAGGTSDGGDVTFTTPVAITLSAGTSQSVFGRRVTLSGTLAGAAAGAQVTLLADPLGQAAFSTLATVLTGSGGSWSYQARPTIQTTYEASASAGTSAPVTVGVRPAVTLRVIAGARFLVTIAGSASWAGRLVKLQRLGPLGGWQTLARVRLGVRSSVRIPARRLPFGSSTIRVAMSINQAGRGYLAGFSRTLVYVRT